MADDILETQVAGNRGALFGMVVKIAFLTVASLGFYSFWARTRLRRWMWSSVRPGGMPLEYTGQPLEKMMGFFVAAVFVSFYVGLVVMLFMFLGLQYAGSQEVGLIGALLLLMPLYFFAQYRGRRYLLNHTSWRGLSFSMKPAAFGYLWRAIMYYALLILSLGLLWPLMTFQLQKYMIDRTYFGDERFYQGGKAWMLYRAFVPLFVGTIATLGVTAYAIAFELPGYFGLYVLTLPLMGVGWAYYKVAGFRMMASEIVFSGGTEFDVYPRTGRVIFVHIMGNILIWLLLSLIVPIFAAMLLVIGQAGLSEFSIDALSDLPPWVYVAAPILFYVAFFVFRAQLVHVFITFPKLKHALETLVIYDAHFINDTKQGKDRHMHDADGLSAIFDFGGGI